MVIADKGAAHSFIVVGIIIFKVLVHSEAHIRSKP